MAGTSTASIFNGKAQVGPLFLGDIVAPRAMDMHSKYSMFLLAQSKNPREVWDTFCGGCLGIFGPPKSIQMDEGGERQDEIWTDSCAERCIKLQFQGAGAHPWLLERRNWPARGIYNRLVEDDRFSCGQIPSEAQWCLREIVFDFG